MTLQYIPVSSLGAGALFLISLFLFLAAVTIALRIYCIRLINRKFQVHDHLIFLALFFACCHVTVIYLAIMVGGMGHHITDVPPTSIITLLKLFFTAELTWLFSTTVVKLSVLVLYLDIFKVQVTFRRFVYGFLVFIGAFFIGFFVSVLTVCQPVSHLWNPTGPGFCGNSTSSQLATSSINTIVDLAIVVLPLPVVFKLQLPNNKKWKVMAIFGVGGIICLINIARLVTTAVLSQVDLTYNLIGPAIITCLEVEVGIINACLPTINPIFSRASSSGRGWRLVPMGSSWGLGRGRTDNSSRTTGQQGLRSDRSHDLYPGSGVSKSTASTMVQSKVSHHEDSTLQSISGKESIMVTRDYTVEADLSRPQSHETRSHSIV